MGQRKQKLVKTILARGKNRKFKAAQDPYKLNKSRLQFQGDLTEKQYQVRNAKKFHSRILIFALVSLILLPLWIIVELFYMN